MSTNVTRGRRRNGSLRNRSNSYCGDAAVKANGLRAVMAEKHNGTGAEADLAIQWLDCEAASHEQYKQNYLKAIPGYLYNVEEKGGACVCVLPLKIIDVDFSDLLDEEAGNNVSRNTGYFGKSVLHKADSYLFMDPKTEGLFMILRGGLGDFVGPHLRVEGNNSRINSAYTEDLLAKARGLYDANPEGVESLIQGEDLPFTEALETNIDELTSQEMLNKMDILGAVFEKVLDTSINIENPAELASIEETMTHTLINVSAENAGKTNKTATAEVTDVLTSNDIDGKSQAVEKLVYDYISKIEDPAMMTHVLEHMDELVVLMYRLHITQEALILSEITTMISVNEQSQGNVVNDMEEALQQDAVNVVDEHLNTGAKIGGASKYGSSVNTSFTKSFDPKSARTSENAQYNLIASRIVEGDIAQSVVSLASANYDKVISNWESKTPGDPHKKILEKIWNKAVAHMESETRFAKNDKAYKDTRDEAYRRLGTFGSLISTNDNYLVLKFKRSWSTMIVGALPTILVAAGAAGVTLLSGGTGALAAAGTALWYGAVATASVVGLTILVDIAANITEMWYRNSIRTNIYLSILRKITTKVYVEFFSANKDANTVFRNEATKIVQLMDNVADLYQYTVDPNRMVGLSETFWRSAGFYISRTHSTGTVFLPSVTKMFWPAAYRPTSPEIVKKTEEVIRALESSDGGLASLTFGRASESSDPAVSAGITSFKVACIKQILFLTRLFTTNLMQIARNNDMEYDLVTGAGGVGELCGAWLGLFLHQTIVDCSILEPTPLSAISSLHVIGVILSRPVTGIVTRQVAVIKTNLAMSTQPLITLKDGLNVLWSALRTHFKFYIGTVQEFEGLLRAKYGDTVTPDNIKDTVVEGDVLLGELFKKLENVQPISVNLTEHKKQMNEIKNSIDRTYLKVVSEKSHPTSALLTFLTSKDSPFGYFVKEIKTGNSIARLSVVKGKGWEKDIDRTITTMIETAATFHSVFSQYMRSLRDSFSELDEEDLSDTNRGKIVNEMDILEASIYNVIGDSDDSFSTSPIKKVAENAESYKRGVTETLFTSYKASITALTEAVSRMHAQAGVFKTALQPYVPSIDAGATRDVKTQLNAVSASRAATVSSVSVKPASASSASTAPAGASSALTGFGNEPPHEPLGQGQGGSVSAADPTSVSSSPSPSPTAANSRAAAPAAITQGSAAAARGNAPPPASLASSANSASSASSATVPSVTASQNALAPASLASSATVPSGAASATASRNALVSARSAINDAQLQGLELHEAVVELGQYGDRRRAAATAATEANDDEGQGAILHGGGARRTRRNRNRTHKRGNKRAAHKDHKNHKNRKSTRRQRKHTRKY